MTTRPPVFALFQRSLQAECRSGRTYLVRAVLAVLILLSLSRSHVGMFVVSAAGLRFLRSVVYINLVFITLAGFNYFSSVITEEKEERTLELLQLCNIGPVAVMLGKSTSRLLGILLLLLTQFPFTLLAVTLGGVSLTQVFAAYATLLAYAVLVSNMALLSSVLCKRTQQASSLTCGFLALLLFAKPLGLLAYEILVSGFGVQRGRVLVRTLLRLADWLGTLNPFARVSTIMSSAFRGPAVGLHVPMSLGVAFLFFWLSWAAFDRFARESRGARRRWNLLGRIGSPSRWFGRGRTWPAALAWKDFHFLAGGRTMVIGRFALLVAIVAIMGTGAGLYMPSREWVGNTLMVWCLLLTAAEVLSFPSRMIHDELKHKTLADLRLLPVTTSQLLYLKFLGVLPAVTPYAVGFFLGMLLSPRHFAEAAGDLFGSAVGWYLLVQVIPFVYFATYLSLYLKRFSGVVAIGIWIVGNIIFLLIFASGGEAGLYAGCAMSVLFFVPVTVSLHGAIARRVDELAGL